MTTDSASAPVARRIETAARAGDLDQPASAALRIERVDVFGVAMPLVGPGFSNAYTTKKVQKSAIVRVVGSDGSIGLGNIDPSPGYSVETIEASLDALRN